MKRKFDQFDLDCLHELEKKLLNLEEDESYSQWQYSNLLEQGLKIFQTIKEISTNDRNIGEQTRKAFYDAIFFFTLELLCGKNKNDALVLLRQTVEQFSLAMLSVVSGLGVKELKKMLKEHGQISAYLTEHARELLSFGYDEHRDIDLHIIPEYFLYYL